MSFRPTIIQYAWVVPKLEDAARLWFDTTGVGPFLINRDLRLDQPRYRGAPSLTRFSTAVAQHGDVQIELVEQLDDTPSAYRETVAAGATGFHHIAFISADFDADLAHYTDRGHTIAADGNFGPMRYVYVDTVAALGHMVEIVEDKPAIRAFFGGVRKAAERWDRDPATLLRELG
ncbi:ABC transporter permease [Nostoc sp. 3335mG]|nr:ABC transporter permease [Nostoc sp. 3335mG]